MYFRTRVQIPAPPPYAASKFIKALKGRPVSGWAYVPAGKEHVRLDAANAEDAPDIFARQAECGVKWAELGAVAFAPDGRRRIEVAFDDSHVAQVLWRGRGAI